MAIKEGQSIWIVLYDGATYCVCASRELAEQFQRESGMDGLDIEEYALSNTPRTRIYINGREYKLLNEADLPALIQAHREGCTVL